MVGRGVEEGEREENGKRDEKREREEIDSIFTLLKPIVVGQSVSQRSLLSLVPSFFIHIRSCSSLFQ